MDRRELREYALDGARLYFQPATGVHVRVATAATRDERRRAPRVAMFGITNACNLACDFCSRDVTRASGWTVASAAAVLRELSAAGTLEVAYGGGEPFVFRGFDELVAELHTTSLLAQHVTTNGTLIRAATWGRFAGRFGQVRITIYDGTPWLPAAEVLAGHGQRWGANLIVDGAALAGLPATLATLAARGAHDVSLLGYVGPEAARHLDRAGEARLAAIIADAPLPCRLSVCFGDRIAVPRLPTGDDAGDCGAGRDFVSITPDRRVQSCSFQERSLPGATAAEILAAWRLQQPMLAAPSPRRGCARTLPLTRRAAAAPPIAVWQAFSGNNSGECVMVARFTSVTDAEAYLAELLPGWAGDGTTSAAWRALFAAEKVEAPDSTESYGDTGPAHLLAIGRSVLATAGAADDAFPSLRALAWKRGAHVLPGGVHVHGDLYLLAAIRAADARDRDALLSAAAPLASVHHAHGEIVFAFLPLRDRDDRDGITGARDLLFGLAGDRALAAEIVFDEEHGTDLVAALQQLGHRPPSRPRLWIQFPWYEDRSEEARTFARTLGEGRAIAIGSAVLVDPAPDRKRLAVLAYRRRCGVVALDDRRIAIDLYFYDGGDLDLDALPGLLPPGTTFTLHRDPHHRPGGNPTVTAVTDDPASVLRVAIAHAATLGAKLWIHPHDANPLAAAVRRLADDLR